MAEVIRTENRTCPFCKFEYIRTVYATDRNRGSICPECRRRSDADTVRVSKWHAPKLKECEQPGCNKTFFTNGRQKYCRVCGIEIDVKQRRDAVRRFRARAKMGKQNES